ncbi:hypothetical protein K492DRAFT_207992 [Lichtheimia hyalospora FSU 10163]|uniref:50S ribosomal protein L35 n=1 Tax=Lichtheimia ramosa TaxID=688394 RepID=A0A077W637_9FUNG|nr:hypothetical protein K492DRAFT_207992 [Lichtheimia hyalospora FSU 10163]CDS02887.1 hypothetical protein LRAMOSA00289 [Lichtheimia ramosa]
MFGILTAAARNTFAVKPQGQAARGMAYKLKSHSGAKKRFFPTSNGNFKRWKVGLRHLNVTFSPERVNRLSRSVLVNNTQKKMLHKVLPYK